MKAVNWCIVILALFSIVVISGCSSSAPTSSQAATQPANSAPQSQPAANQGVIKIGHLRPLTGQMAPQSQIMIKSFDFAFQQVNYQVAGKQIQIITGDSLGQAQPAVDVAKKMVQNDKVSLLVGPMSTAEVMAVANYANQAGIPQLLTTPADDGTIDPQLKWTLSLGGIPSQYSAVMGAYAYEQAKLRKLDVITGDWAPGHEYLNDFMAKFKSDGGQIVQEQYTPVPTHDFAAYLTGLKDADAVACWFNGSDAIAFLTQYHEMGIDKKMPLLAAFNGAFMASYVLSGLPPADADATVGYLLSAIYTPLLDNPLNKQFLADYQAKFNDIPDDTSSGAYIGGLAVIQALKATGGDASPDKLSQALLSVSFDSPRGTVKFDPQTHGSIMTVYICKVAKQGNAYLWQPVFTYKDIPSLGLK